MAKSKITWDPPSDELRAELEEKHGEDIVEVEDRERVFLLAKPERPRDHLERMTTLAGNEKKRLDAAEGLVKACCVFPDKDTLKRVFFAEPGLALGLGEHCSELLGVRQLAAKK